LSGRIERFDVVVIGAGAAGLYAAAEAGKRGLRVLVLEHTGVVGAKILISGGGRCNFTNLDVRPDRFVSGNPHFARSALSRHTQEDFIALVKAHGIAFYEKTLGQLFCEGAGSARRIVDMLLAECAAGGVAVRTGASVTRLSRSDDFALSTNLGEVAAKAVVVATGGLSIPKLGATPFAFDLARHFGVPVVPTRPGLVPLTFAPDDLALMRPLSGVSVEAEVACGSARFREGLLFTHRGLSGPSILQISSHLTPGGSIRVDLAAGRDVRAALLEAKRERPKARALTMLGEILPARLAEAWLARHDPGGARLSGPLGGLSDKPLIALADGLKNWTVTPSGDEGYAKAEVTLGGIDTDALDQKTMAVKAVPGLHFIGECVDVTGWLGGYNFQWAWSSGAAAGRGVLA
jgi:predicted Rossmann fold flavoprotein